MGKTKIEWATDVWNPVVGCSVISPGCTNCYAMKMAARLERMGSPIYAGHTQDSKAGPVWNGKVSESNWGVFTQPLRWKRSRRIFVNSMSDLFHEGIPDATIDRVFAVMALCPQHTFQVLTKRADRMRAYLTARNGMGNAALCRAINDIPAQLGNRHGALEMPLPNVWLGVSVEDQKRADERIPDLLETPAAVRFLSCEPLLGRVDLSGCGNHYTRSGPLHIWKTDLPGNGGWRKQFSEPPPQIDWVIVGGESGPSARPMHPDWACSLRDQCQAAKVPLFFKQWGEYIPEGQAPQADVRLNLNRRRWVDPASGGDLYSPKAAAVHPVGKKRAGRLLDGRTWDEMPGELPA